MPANGSKLLYVLLRYKPFGLSLHCSGYRNFFGYPRG